MYNIIFIPSYSLYLFWLQIKSIFGINKIFEVLIMHTQLILLTLNCLISLQTSNPAIFFLYGSTMYVFVPEYSQILWGKIAARKEGKNNCTHSAFHHNNNKKTCKNNSIYSVPSCSRKTNWNNVIYKWNYFIKFFNLLMICFLHTKLKTKIVFN